MKFKCDGICRSCWTKAFDYVLWEILSVDPAMEEDMAGLKESQEKCQQVFQHLEDEKWRREAECFFKTKGRKNGSACNKKV